MTRNQIIGAASSVFLIPSFVYTVWPHVAHDPGQAVCNALGIIALPFVPFALRRCRDPGSFLVLLVLGVMVLTYNFQNALDALNGRHAVVTGTARDRITTAAALNKNISDLDVRKGEVDAHKIVSAEAAQAAQEQRDHECGNGNGPKCRDLDGRLSAIKRDRGLTERAEKIEHEQDGARVKLAAMGAIEKTADQTASQLAGFASLFWSPAANSGETISTNRPIFKASVVEAMGGIMPWVLVTIFGTVPAMPKAEPSAGAVRAKRYRDRKRDAKKNERDEGHDGECDASCDAKTAVLVPENREVRDNVIDLPSSSKRKRKRRESK